MFLLLDKDFTYKYMYMYIHIQKYIFYVNSLQFYSKYRNITGIRFGKMSQIKVQRYQVLEPPSPCFRAISLLSCAGRERQFQLGTCKCKRNCLPTTRTWQLLTLQLDSQTWPRPELSSFCPPLPPYHLSQIVSCQGFGLPSRLEN